jgi:hypothetical protein
LEDGEFLLSIITVIPAIQAYSIYHCYGVYTALCVAVVLGCVKHILKVVGELMIRHSNKKQKEKREV